MPGEKIYYYSDVLCIWAYIAERRVAQLVQDFGDRIEIEARFVSVFPDAWTKIETVWAGRGEFAGFNRHLQEVAQEFDHIDVHENLWLDSRPRTSASAHLFLKAIGLFEAEQSGTALPYPERLSTRATSAIRGAFFGQARDISDWPVQLEIAGSLGVDASLIADKVRSPQAFAALAADYDQAQKNGVTGSPTFIMNNGRQRLFGNVGYRLLEANVHELLNGPARDDASWC